MKMITDERRDFVKDKILLFIPAYNCEKQLPRVLAQLDNSVMRFITEIIIINNLSTDHTVQAATDYLKQHPELPCKIINNNKNYNLGGSHKVAFHYALKYGFDYVIVLHGDDQANIHDFIPVLRSGAYRKADCVLGGRFEKDSRLIGYSRMRILGNHVFNRIYSLATGIPIRDMGSGLNMYHTTMLSSRYYVNLSDALFFNAEMLLFSAYYQHKMKFFPITWREEDQVSNAKLFQLSWNMLKMAGKYAFFRDDFIRSYQKPDIYHGTVVLQNLKKDGAVHE